MQTLLSAALALSAVSVTVGGVTMEIPSSSAHTGMDLTPGNSGNALLTNEALNDVDFSVGEDGVSTYWSWTEPSEWIEFTVDVPSYSTYKLSSFYATKKVGAAIHVNTGGSDYTIDMPLTGGWEVWQSSPTIDVPLAAGVNIIRVTDISSQLGVDENGMPIFNKLKNAFNLLSLTLEESPGTAPSTDAVTPTTHVHTVVDEAGERTVTTGASPPAGSTSSVGAEQAKVPNAADRTASYAIHMTVATSLVSAMLLLC
jgi:hypothetical protein